MFNEVLLGKKPSVLAPALAATESALVATTPQPVAEPKGIRGFFQQAQRPGGFFERLGTFGAELQDINDGGNRMAQRQQMTLRNQESELKAKEAADAARVREQINQVAAGLNLQGTDRLRFLVDPEGLLKDRWSAEQPDDPTVLNTSRGVYEYNGGQGRWLEEFQDDPLDIELKRAQIAATQASEQQRRASAERARRPAAARSSGGGRQAAPSPQASGRPWERKW